MPTARVLLRTVDEPERQGRDRGRRVHGARCSARHSRARCWTAPPRSRDGLAGERGHAPRAALVPGVQPDQAVRDWRRGALRPGRGSRPIGAMLVDVLANDADPLRRVGGRLYLSGIDRNAIVRLECQGRLRLRGADTHGPGHAGHWRIHSPGARRCGSMAGAPGGERVSGGAGARGCLSEGDRAEERADRRGVGPLGFGCARRPTPRTPRAAARAAATSAGRSSPPDHNSGRTPARWRPPAGTAGRGLPPTSRSRS